jgi:alkanesulfonate monooxygenase SsuD/methylene tetrahydromethanopterin reductase-like flavin-dependent oxidoreductase (luciferase family)
MLALNVFAADTQREAERLFTSLQQQFLNLIRGTPGQLRPPVEDIDALWQPGEQAHVERSLSCAVVGDRDTVQEALQAFIDEHAPDELIITAQNLRSRRDCIPSRLQPRPVPPAGKMWPSGRSHHDTVKRRRGQALPPFSCRPTSAGNYSI